MKRIIFSFSFLFFLVQTITAQNINDALRYTVLEGGGTARTVGVGGAIGALGADFSVLSTNPAGAAVFRRSEFTFTPTLDFSNFDATLDGQGNSLRQEDKTNFNFNNIGIVFSSRPLSSKWKTSVFGIGVNRLANYHQNIYFEGTSFGSITDRWWELADGLTSDQLDAFEAGLAYDAEALYEDVYDPTFYFTDFLDENLQIGNILVDKSQNIRRKGSLNELVFTLAGNYDEKLMVGATVGVPILSYEETKTYVETDDDDRIAFFDELVFTERLRSTGAGINLKLGLIYRLNQMVRLGFAVHTPSGIGIDDSFSTSLSYQYTDNVTQRLEENSPEATFEYRLRTPWRMIGSGAVIINKSGFLSAELEYVNYSSSKFTFKNTNNPDDLAYEQELNDEINANLGSALNIRFGGEYAFNAFRLRAGYHITASPYLDDGDSIGAFSAGAGFRGESFFLDFAYRRSNIQSTYTPYLLSSPELEQSVSLEEQLNRFMLTIGFKL